MTLEAPRPSGNLPPRTDGVVPGERKIVSRNPAREPVIGAAQSGSASESQPQTQSFIRRHRLPLAVGAGVVALVGTVAALAGASGGEGGSDGGNSSNSGAAVDATPTKGNVTVAAAQAPTEFPTRIVIPTTTGTVIGKDSGISDPTKPVTTAPNTPEPTATTKPTQVPTPTSRPTEAVPTATPVPTEAPKPATILDRPITAVTIDKLRSEASSTYDTKPQAFTDTDGTIWKRSSFEASIKGCESGTPDSAGNAKLIAQERLGICAGIVRKMVVLYKLNGDPALLQIAADARSYFVGQYPDLKGQFDDFLSKSGVK